MRVIATCRSGFGAFSDGFRRLQWQKWRRRPESNRGPRICNPLRFYIIQLHTGIATLIATLSENLSVDDIRGVDLRAVDDIIGYSSIYSYINLETTMGLVKKSITVTDHQEKWIKAQVESGQYGNDSEYFRDLLRRDEEQNAKFQALKAAIQEGLDSGVSDKTVLDVWREAEERYTAKHG